MKKILAVPLILIGTLFFSLTDLNAAELPPLDIYVNLNGTNIFFENTGNLQGDPDNPYSNVKSLPKGTEMTMTVNLNDYKSLVGRYLIAVVYCSTAYPSLGNIATPGTPDFINSTFIANYSSTTAGASCKVGDYTGSVYKAVYAINRNIRLADNFGIRLWGGTTFDYVTWFKVNSVSVYDYTPDVENSFQNIKNQQDLENKLNNLNNSQQETNSKLDDLNNKTSETNDFLKDDTAPNSDISALGNVQGLLPPGPVDSLLNIPFTFLSIVVSSLSGTCVPLTGDFVFGSTLSIPCFGDTFYNNVPPGLMIFINLIPSAFILIQYLKHLYKKVDRAVSLQTTTEDEWGVI